MSAHLLLAAGDPVEADLVQASGLDLVDAVDDDGGHHGGGVGRVVRQVPAPAMRSLVGRLLGRASGDTGKRNLVTTFSWRPSIPTLISRT